jgi:L-ascorbate metabolism protein UlaG (beta-lactamase superfamily)
MTESHLDRRGFLRGAAAGAALATVTATTARASAAPTTTTTTTTSRRARGATTTFQWLGTSGWRIEIGSRTLLIDPYLSRFRTGLFDGAFNPATPLTVDEEAIAEHAGQPETILVTHSHWDHFNDVPHIANRWAARIFGTLTTYHLALAFGVPSAQLAPVKGGEVLDFGDYTVEVIASLHSRNAAYSVAFPGVHADRLAQDETPATIADLPEGDTLAFQLMPRGGPSVFFMGASDFVERNLVGLRPDVAMIAVPATDVTFSYVPRLIAALDRPGTVVPVHWENFETPLENPPQTTPADKQRLDAFVAAVRKAAPRTNVVIPEYLTPYTLP